MSGNLILGRVQLGDDEDPTKNFTIMVPSPQDGTLEIRRGNADAPGTLVLSVGIDGILHGMGLLGVDQTWQDMTANRVLGTPYVNNTGKPIYVIFKATGSASNPVPAITVNGLIVSQSSPYTPGAGYYFETQAIVPPGASYVLTCTNGTIATVRELR